MDKMTTIKQNVLKIAYEIAKDCVPFSENIKIDSRYTSNSLDGCTTENGRALINDDKMFTVYVGYGNICVCMVRFEAETLVPKTVSVGKGIPGKKDFDVYEISDIEEIKSHTAQIQTHLRNLLN